MPLRRSLTPTEQEAYERAFDAISGRSHDTKAPGEIGLGERGDVTFTRLQTTGDYLAGSNVSIREVDTAAIEAKLDSQRAMLAAENAQQSADGKSTVYYADIPNVGMNTLASPPTGRNVGDTWFPEDGSIRSWDGKAWKKASLEAGLTADQVRKEISTATIDAATQLTGQVPDKNLAGLSAAKLIGTVVDSQIAAGLDAAKVAGALANAALPAANLAGQVKGTQIEDGSISTPKLVANSITTSQLVIAGANLVADPVFASRAVWPASDTVSYDATAGHNGHPAMIVGANTVQTGTRQHLTNGPVSVKPGARYRFTAWCKNTVATSGGVDRGILAVYTNSTPAWPYLGQGNGPTVSPAGQENQIVLEFTVPAGATQVAFGLYSSAAVTGQLIFSDPYCVELVDSSVVVDGTLTASKLAANTITAASGVIADAAITGAKIADAAIGGAKIADAAITNAKIADATITTAKIAALDARVITTGTLSAGVIGANTITGDKLSADAINGKIITGATLQTAASGARTVVDANGMRVLGSDGALMLQIGQNVENGMVIRSPSNVMIPLSDAAFGTQSVVLANGGSLEMNINGGTNPLGNIVMWRVPPNGSPQLSVTPWTSKLLITVGCTFTIAPVSISDTNFPIFQCGVLATANKRPIVVLSANGKDEGGRICNVQYVGNQFSASSTITAQGLISVTPGTPVNLGLQIAALYSSYAGNGAPTLWTNLGSLFVTAQPIAR